MSTATSSWQRAVEGCLGADELRVLRFLWSSHPELVAPFLAAVPRAQDGAALAEYGILIAFIAIAAIVAVTFFGDPTRAFFFAARPFTGAGRGRSRRSGRRASC